jgi:hypothetical protein
MIIFQIFLNKNANTLPNYLDIFFFFNHYIKESIALLNKRE